MKLRIILGLVRLCNLLILLDFIFCQVGLYIKVFKFPTSYFGHR